ncbi:Rrf2 family transcriptional regulator [Sphingosinicella sp. BN140058]|uniref:RrF2 family transcriptional regulator n=1 Tax=Sphingosinicella sp. BN140058 TaxID=1892855 RepID=UPI001010D08A|nr:Rrf2 family transcriptional regulator [Sphingosinicella sp. BN140058]QAY78951.1 Rrf2 family transcriptional regulator [Sphingosinicella sp. BN140058]
MAHLTVSVEYAIHSLLWLVNSGGTPVSTRDLAEFQGLSQSFLAKIFPKLQKAGIVKACEGVRGGYVLARPAEEINFLQIIDAVDGRKPLFDCQEIRGRCAVFGGAPPEWATGGVCAVHVVMLQAEKAMRDTLARQSLGTLSRALAGKAPPEFGAGVQAWLGARVQGRTRRPGDTLPTEREVE